ncbi:AzlC family ABC transporter permease [Leucobacter sp. cx-169]|uniref:AzlC family ABC transporter permease n=1 Tax=unclassified Leucobacter TaxID=2621730 RepID=UPI00203EF2F5|nr:MULTISPECIES: AzlC family ABC transporter permease [unclassified Leucobacter]
MSVGLGVFPLGIALGFLVVQVGLPGWVAPALSIVVFAGSVELLLTTMLAAVAPLSTIAVAVFAVNFRHVFYAFSFPIEVVRPGFARAYSVYAMIDEAYATAALMPREVNSSTRMLTMQVACHAYWVAGGLVGLAIASALPAPIEGFEFALCALFIVMTLDAFRSKRELPSVLLAGVSASVALLATPGAAMLVALILFAALLALRYALVREHEPVAPEEGELPHAEH